MSNACTKILVGVASLVSKLKFGQIFLSDHGLYIGPWLSKNLIDRNQLKKLMQVGVDVKCMHTNFSWCGLSGFRDIVTFQNGQISLLNHGL